MNRILRISQSRSVVSNFLWPRALQPTRLLCPWDSPGQNTRVGSHSLLQGIFPSQGSSPGLPHCRQILYPLSHRGGTRTLECVACPFSRGSSWPRNWTGVKWQSTPALLPGKSHGGRSLIGYSPWGRKSWTQLSDFTPALQTASLPTELYPSYPMGTSWKNHCVISKQGCWPW